jgi:hypothetical protein
MKKQAVPESEVAVFSFHEMKVEASATKGFVPPRQIIFVVALRPNSKLSAGNGRLFASQI